MILTKLQIEKIAAALNKIHNPLSATSRGSMGKGSNPMKSHGVQPVSARKRHATQGEVMERNKKSSTMVDERLI